MLDGRVIEVMATGITVQSGPIKTFISLKVSLTALIESIIEMCVSMLCRKTDLTMYTTSSRTLGCNETTWLTKNWSEVFMCATESQHSSTSITSSVSLARSMATT